VRLVIYSDIQFNPWKEFSRILFMVSQVWTKHTIALLRKGGEEGIYRKKHAD
jgi:hypothetical protein